MLCSTVEAESNLMVTFSTLIVHFDGSWLYVIVLTAPTFFMSHLNVGSLQIYVDKVYFLSLTL